MIARSILCLAVLSLLACNTPDPKRDFEAGARLAKVHIREMGYDPNDLVQRGDPQNLEWDQYWARVQEVATPEIKGWNDRIHTLYAIFFAPMNPDQAAIWVFVDRKSGQIVGTLKQVQGLHPGKS